MKANAVNHSGVSWTYAMHTDLVSLQTQSLVRGCPSCPDACCWSQDQMTSFESLHLHWTTLSDKTHIWMMAPGRILMLFPGHSAFKDKYYKEKNMYWARCHTTLKTHNGRRSPLHHLMVARKDSHSLFPCGPSNDKTKQHLFFTEQHQIACLPFRITGMSFGLTRNQQLKI